MSSGRDIHGLSTTRRPPTRAGCSERTGDSLLGIGYPGKQPLPGFTNMYIQGSDAGSFGTNIAAGPRLSTTTLIIAMTLPGCMETISPAGARNSFATRRTTSRQATWAGRTDTFVFRRLHRELFTARAQLEYVPTATAWRISNWTRPKSRWWLSHGSVRSAAMAQCVLCAGRLESTA